MGPERKNNSALEIFKVSPLIKKAVEIDSQRWQEERKKKKENTSQTLKEVFGEGVSPENYINPSTASNCLRWMGYEILGTFKPLPHTFKQDLEMMMGSANHFALLRKVTNTGLGFQEQSFVKEKEGISGRLDLFFQNPKTKEWQIIDFKFKGSFAFRQIKREGLSPELKNLKDLYQPTSEDRLQILLYIWAKRKEGYKVSCGNIVYVNRDMGEIKEAVVFWDEKAKHEVETFLEKAKKALQAVEKGELPEPSVVSKYICAKYCSYRIYCDYGQKFAAGEVRKERRNIPKWVRIKAKKEAEERERKAKKIGLSQLELPINSNDD